MSELASASVSVSAATAASATYKKLTQLEHILLRADTYVGSKVPEKVTAYIPEKIAGLTNSTHSPSTTTCPNAEDSQDSSAATVDPASPSPENAPKMVLREITYVPAFMKVVDEILVNAADNKARDPDNCNAIKVDLDVENGVISIWNNGKGVPIQIHDKEAVYIPEMVFGHLLTGSNFDDDEKRIVGGRNGYGAKLTNIYSTSFTIETHDSASGKTYKQTWTDNMSKCGKAMITEKKKTADYTRVTFHPDFNRLNMQRIDADSELIVKKRVYDLTGSLRGVRVSLNGVRIKVNSFKDYVSMYLGTGMNLSSASDSSSSAVTLDKSAIVYDKAGERWEIAVALSETGAFQQVSFVNSIATTKGGTHVNHVADQIIAKLVEAVKKKDKNAVVKPAQIKNQIFLFVNCLIENASFDSQTKEYMTLRPHQFGSACSISELFMKRVAKLGIVETTLSMVHEKEHAQLKKTDGAKRSRLTGIVKLDDANDAGSRKAKNCTLFLTEGLSAKTFAVTGIPALKNGRDLYGAYPLRGKLLNVRDASIKQKLENQELTELKQILGLQEGKVYTSVDSLRYGRICCLVDSDYDGRHIKGLIINWLETSYPSLLQIPGFLVDFVSPIVKVTRGAEKRLFYDLVDYEEWKTANDGGSAWTIKYYKGLGTSKPADIKTYFTSLDTHLNSFKPLTHDDSVRLDMVFAKKRAAERKQWLAQYDTRSTTTRCCPRGGSYSIESFIDNELIEFSAYDNIRSIPAAIDGLKPGQRKILYTALSTKLTKDVKVAQFAGDVAKLTEYRHGEQSLCETIVGMAQSYVGSNNIALLSPEGQFGTRLQGGKDAASPRYIYTKLSAIARKIFHQDDDSLLEYIVEDGMTIEPVHYVPLLPLVLVNGCEGIGTGYSTTVLPHDPKEIAQLLRAKAAATVAGHGESDRDNVPPLKPFHCGFTGETTSLGDGKWLFSGKIQYMSGNTYEITELPVGTWTESYKGNLEKMIQEELVRDYKEYHTDTTVRFVVKGTEKLARTLANAATVPTEASPSNDEDHPSANLLTTFKLTSSKSENNMMLFNSLGKLQKYNTCEDILDEFYRVRIAFYIKRKEALLKDITEKLVVAKNKARFVSEIITGSLVLAARKRCEIESDLFAREYERSNDSYSYLLNMSLTTLTSEKIEELQAKQCDLDEQWKRVSNETAESIYIHDLDEILAAEA